MILKDRLGLMDGEKIDREGSGIRIETTGCVSSRLQQLFQSGGDSLASLTNGTVGRKALRRSIDWAKRRAIVYGAREATDGQKDQDEWKHFGERLYSRLYSEAKREK